MKILVTGFDPFGGEKINPAYETIKRLDNNIKKAEIVKLEIPTVFQKSIKVLNKKIAKEKPDVVLCIGQAGGRYDITVERVAINIDDARIRDNEGKQPVDEHIFYDGDTAYFSNLPIKAMVKNIRRGNIPASISNSAGTFVCNHIMYGLLYLIDKKYPDIRGGFIHVPFLPQQVVDKNNTPSMNLKDITKALTLAIEGAIDNDKDIKTVEGKTH
ncbi:pyroglutamyl-peptidase I [Anaerosalibacter massiliensis]|uniref:Pyrrolidone-carboxylate peptidase n=1 Tax=Anaerosalibacter massiliensis TaxID=1347392 RepID=A0A9X2MIY1_9FIRM|nr:pyroglutamyl-peptidase I [Anaerosalibacter massiliensis]MCR2044509.1 pyroglutamyl-peptidase I [Anaerosalibacter massiliensis]